MRETTEQALRAGGLDPADVRRVIVNAFTEDLGPDFLDVTSVATIPATQTDTADLVARADGVVAGLAVAAAVFEVVGEVTGADGAQVPSRCRWWPTTASGWPAATCWAP